MYKELTITIDGKPLKVFLHNGSHLDIPVPKILHKHLHSEVHFFVGGTAQFQTGNEILFLPNNSMVLVPPGKFHTCICKDENTKHVAFQISFPIEQDIIAQADPSAASEFIKAFEQSACTGDYSIVATYATFFCSFLCRTQPVKDTQVNDPKFLISEFFSHQYHTDARLEDLAEELCMSVRQTERTVIDVTGRCFRDMLVCTRMEVAKHLLETTNMTLSEIAEAVGYRSYAGFWKAAKKHGLF